jgi:hypothetical protein
MIADPNLQLLFPVTLPARLFLPETLGFNVMVALPVPLAAIGAFLFLRRRFTAPAAALGALVIALSGPFRSSLTSPNLSTSIAIAPCALGSRPRGRAAIRTARRRAGCDHRARAARR